MNEEGKRTSENKGRMKREKGNIFGITMKVLAFVYVVITIMFFVSIMKMNLLPGLYVTIFTISEVVFTIAMVIGIVKKRKKKVINIVCLIIIIIVSAVYCFAMNYIFATIGFMDSMFSETEETEEYYVVVRKSSSYEKIEDIKGKNVYLFQVEDDVKAEIGGKVDITLRVQESLTEMGKNLLDSKIDAILVGSSQYSMLSEEVEKFEANTKIIYKATHKIEKKTEIQSNDTKYSVKTGVFNVYISGIDTSGRISNVSRSDANIIATVNTKTHEVLITSIPRDYYVTLHSKGAKDKLTHSGIYGISETVTTVEDLLDIDINYYVRVNFTTLIKLIDTLGGVDVYSDYDFSRSGYNFTKGYNRVNGEAALVFSRERYSFSGGDNQRVKNQQHVIEAIIKKVLNSNTILTKYTSILNSLDGTFQTNIDQSDISNLVKDQIQNMSSWTIKNNALTGTGSSSSTYSMGSQKLYVMIPDSSSVQKAKNQIDEIMGE